LYICKNKN